MRNSDHNCPVKPVPSLVESISLRTGSPALRRGKSPKNQCECCCCWNEMCWWTFPTVSLSSIFKNLFSKIKNNVRWIWPDDVSASGSSLRHRCMRVNTVSLDLTAAILDRFLPEAQSNKHLREAAAGWCESVMRLCHMTDMQCSCLFSSQIQMIPVETSIYCLTYQSFLPSPLGWGKTIFLQ